MTGVDPLRVSLIDDHLVFTEGLSLILERDHRVAICGTAATAKEGVELVRNEQPDIVLLDVDLDGDPAERTIRRILRATTNTRIVILTMHTETTLLDSLIRAGATAWLNKSSTGSEILERCMAAATEPRSSPPAPQPRPAPGLTRRETEVLRLVSLAQSNRQVAEQLSITEGTVKRHLHDIYRKLDATTRIDAVRKATTIGILG